MESGRYIDGIVRAIDAGLIVFQNPHSAPFGPPDPWGHLAEKEIGPAEPGGVWKYNSRPLHPVAEMLISAAEVPPEMRVLGLGAGIGSALAALRRMFVRARIHAVGLTPVNPYLLPVHDFQRERQALMPGRSEMSVVSPDVLLAMRDTSRRALFEVCQEPFIERQYIGLFQHMRRDQFPAEGYDFLDDSAGVLLHAVPSRAEERESPDTVQERRTAVAALVYSLLRENGALCISNTDDDMLMRRVMRPGDRLCIVNPVVSPSDRARQLVVLTKPGSPFNPVLERLTAEGSVIDID